MSIFSLIALQLKNSWEKPRRDLKTNGKTNLRLASVHIFMSDFVLKSILLIEYSMLGRLRPHQNAGNGLVRPRHARTTQIHQKVLCHEDTWQTEGTAQSTLPPFSLAQVGELVERTRNDFKRAHAHTPSKSHYLFGESDITVPPVWIDFHVSSRCRAGCKTQASGAHVKWEEDSPGHQFSVPR